MARFTDRGFIRFEQPRKVSRRLMQAHAQNEGSNDEGLVSRLLVGIDARRFKDVAIDFAICTRQTRDVRG